VEKEMTESELSGKVALVTGAASGLGRAVALKLAEMGAKLAVNDLPDNRATEEVIELVKNKGGQVIAVPFDVTHGPSITSGFKIVGDTWGKVDILVNNAGILRNRMFLRTSEEDWDAVMDVNLRGTYLCAKFVLPLMLPQNWGRIINMASVAGIVGNMGAVSYSASKGGLIAFTRSLAAEIGSKNITVNAIAPGFISAGLADEISPEAKNAIISRTSLKRAGTPKDIAELAGFLASNKASYITGQVICIDGGIA
jgi:3-oxoacyl-[acyl-carrier protein] reductase